MRKICLFPVMIAVIVFTGCGQKKNEDPVTVTLWHVYGGQTESPLNDLIDEFNETIGKEKNIRVQVGSVTNTNTIHENVLASAFGDPGASKLPDMLSVVLSSAAAFSSCISYLDRYTSQTRSMSFFGPLMLKNFILTIIDSHLLSILMSLPSSNRNGYTQGLSLVYRFLLLSGTDTY